MSGEWDWVVVGLILIFLVQVGFTIAADRRRLKFWREAQAKIDLFYDNGVHYYGKKSEGREQQQGSRGANDESRGEGEGG